MFAEWLIGHFRRLRIVRQTATLERRLLCWLTEC
jgi:hypothetical protein